MAWSVSLWASSTELWPTQYSTLTATANADVGPRSYSIRIRDLETGVIIGCSSGTTCSVPVTRSTSGYRYFMASIVDSSGNAVASSSEVTVFWHPAYLSMSASSTHLAHRLDHHAVGEFLL